MSASDDDRTASLMTPARLAQLQVRPAPAASPTAWLDQMATDAGSGHVRRLQDLRQQLEAEVRSREGDFPPAAASCDALRGAVEQVDFSAVQPRGWLARATGKGKEAVAAFKAQHGKVTHAAEDLADEVRGLQKQLAAQGGGLDKLALEIGAEVRALEKIMDQGARWLQDMRNQLKAREAPEDDPDAVRCELLVARLKLLRTVVSTMQQAVERCKAARARRTSVLASLQQLLDEEWKSAQQKLGAVVREVEESGAADAESLERAGRARETLQGALKQAAQDCTNVQALEQAAADEVAALQVPLQAAA
ncbi:hypothetical protein H8N03_16150 [Ramlibacter sp. USB13]|uniref:Uncharacterized protein n=1 Tax=Ramlibacter cellulosilyticus TaxID=2764187 RepID=A0A923SC10_9BURK|nr:hypothetical protein [Ramlibacter cellulosilyticus]MBC5784481.1 hypothetical protein [Ramlibacter cellulosilyticus]